MRCTSEWRRHSTLATLAEAEVEAVAEAMRQAPLGTILVGTEAVTGRYRRTGLARGQWRSPVGRKEGSYLASTARRGLRNT